MEKPKNVTEITSPKEKENLADNGLWNPNLISDITMVLGTSLIGYEWTSQKDKSHTLGWSTSTGKDDVFVEINDNQQAKLIVNTSRYRSEREYLSLRGIAHKYDLIFDPYEEQD